MNTKTLHEILGRHPNGHHWAEEEYWNAAVGKVECVGFNNDGDCLTRQILLFTLGFAEADE